MGSEVTGTGFENFFYSIASHMNIQYAWLVGCNKDLVLNGYARVGFCLLGYGVGAK